MYVMWCILFFFLALANIPFLLIIIKELFQEKDYLDARFFHKRAFYLACLAAAIHQDGSLNVDMVYDSPDGDSRMTTLVLTHRQGTSYSAYTHLILKILT